MTFLVCNPYISASVSKLSNFFPIGQNHGCAWFHRTIFWGVAPLMKALFTRHYDLAYVVWLTWNFHICTVGMRKTYSILLHDWKFKHYCWTCMRMECEHLSIEGLSIWIHFRFLLKKMIPLMIGLIVWTMPL